MFKDLTTTIAVTDLNRAKEFYENILSLKPDATPQSEPGLSYKVGSGSHLYIYQRAIAPKADHTLASFNVDDVEKTVDMLTQKGVRFERYDTLDGIKTNEKGVAIMGDKKAAWFKDPDGNILGIVQM